MFELVSSPVPGCFEIRPAVVNDLRGRFVKVFHEGAFSELGLETGFVEEYYSVSRRNVLRGMHFQRPPRDHVKLVYCVEGAVLDVALDLRRGSPAYGRCAAFNLSADGAGMVYLPRGLAHGFLVLSERATMVYMVTSTHSPAHDDGVLWNSIGVRWPVEDPVVSERDRRFIRLADFESPFAYGN
jgi:dTDP-4-dehydrorhamnose 3,5-epimerase